MTIFLFLAPFTMIHWNFLYKKQDIFDNSAWSYNLLYSEYKKANGRNSYNIWFKNITGVTKVCRISQTDIFRSFLAEGTCQKDDRGIWIFLLLIHLLVHRKWRFTYIFSWAAIMVQKSRTWLTRHSFGTSNLKLHNVKATKSMGIYVLIPGTW
jgi:hypothetical protein